MRIWVNSYISRYFEQISNISVMNPIIFHRSGFAEFCEYLLFLKVNYVNVINIYIPIDRMSINFKDEGNEQNVFSLAKCSVLFG